MGKRKFMLMILAVGVMFCSEIVIEPSSNAAASVPQLRQKLLTLIEAGQSLKMRQSIYATAKLTIM